jgi:hypothetical protein
MNRILASESPKNPASATRSAVVRTCFPPLRCEFAFDMDRLLFITPHTRYVELIFLRSFTTISGNVASMYRNPGNPPHQMALLT